MSEWRWLREDVILAAHDVQIARHGGLDGIKDRGALESALARPLQLTSCKEPPPDAFDLAAAYAFSLTRNHAFSDGNKRIAWIAARVFLMDNGVAIQFNSFEAIQIMLGLSSGEVPEADFAAWLRRSVKPAATPSYP